jgi:hypothetical protein
MLVTFSCPAHPDITMFGDVALRLIKMMGHSGTVPSAIVAADVPAALKRLEGELARLEAAAATEGDTPAPRESSSTEREEHTVSLRHRVLPLVELLKAAMNAECNVMWDNNQ